MAHVHTCMYVHIHVEDQYSMCQEVTCTMHNIYYTRYMHNMLHEHNVLHIQHMYNMLHVRHITHTTCFHTQTDLVNLGLCRVGVVVSFLQCVHGILSLLTGFLVRLLGLQNRQTNITISLHNKQTNIALGPHKHHSWSTLPLSQWHHKTTPMPRDGQSSSIWYPPLKGILYPTVLIAISPRA